MMLLTDDFIFKDFRVSSKNIFPNFVWKFTKLVLICKKMFGFVIYDLYRYYSAQNVQLKKKKKSNFNRF